MKALDRKLLRDLLHLRGQVFAIALVVACGVATVVTTRTAYESLVSARADYYARYRFADVFAQLKRAPEAVRARIATISGVTAVETRVVADVSLDVPGLDEPAAGRLVSLPDDVAPELNAVHLRSGRRLDSSRRDEVLVSEAFAQANGLEVGDTLGAVLNGRWERLRIVGVALSPEYVYEIRPADLFPDPHRFGVLWMSRSALGPAFDMDGAFNEVSLALMPGASEAEAIVLAEQVTCQFLLIDDWQGRTVAKQRGLPVMGVAGVLLAAKQRALVAEISPLLAELAAVGYRLSAKLVAEVTLLAGEQPKQSL